MPYLLGPRNPLDEAKDTLSSWDKCMAKNYCKWPVIVAIVVGSLIILSVVLCVARCICCGAECACCCFRCCAGCCGSGRGKKHKRMKSDPNAGYPPAYPPAYPPPAIDAHPPNEQYRSHAAPTISPVSKYRAPEPERPQFATFESPSKPVNEDSLPAMPEWGSAKSTRVEEEVIPEKHGDVELDRFDRNGSVAGTSLTGAAALAGPARSTGRSPIQRSPTADSYGFPQGYQNQAIANSPRRSPRNSPGPHGAQFGQQQDPYRGGSPAQSLSPVYGAGAGFAQNQQYGRNSPSQNRGPNYDQQYNRPPQGRTPPPADDYGYGPAELSSDYTGTTLHNNNNYGPARSHTPGYAPPVRSNTAGYAPNEMDASNYAPVRSNTAGYPPTELDASSYPPKELDAPSYAPSYAPVRSNTPGYAVEQHNVAAYAPSSTYTESNYAPEQPSAYPGQQTYAPEPAYPGQQSYQAFQPSAPQGQQESAPARRPINGSWKEV